MSGVKGRIKGNLIMGLVLLICGFIDTLLDLDEHDYLAVGVGIIILIGFFVSLRLIMQSRKNLVIYNKSWIQKALTLLRMGCFILILFELNIKSGNNVDLYVMIAGFTYILEAAYWKRAKLI